MAPILPKQTLDPKLLTSKGLDASNFQSQEDPRVISKMELEKKKKAQQNIVSKVTSRVAQTGQLSSPVIAPVVQTPVEIMKPMNQELPISNPTSLPSWQPIIAWNVSQESLQSKPEVPVKLSVQEFAQKIKTKYPQYEDINDQDLVDKMISKYPTYIDMVEYDIGRQINKAPVPVAPQISYGENKLQDQKQPWSLRRWIASLWGDLWDAERLNPIWRLTEIIDNSMQKIPTFNTEDWAQKRIDKKIKSLSPQEVNNYQKRFNESKSAQNLFWNLENFIREKESNLIESIAWWWVKDTGWPNVPSMIANVPWSLLKTASSTARWITNPVDTMQGLYKLVATDEWQQVIKDRYGSIDNFAKSMNQDPVWVASDILTVVQWWATVWSKVAWLAWKAELAWKLWSVAKTAWWAADLWLWVWMEKLNAWVAWIASKPLRIAAKTALAPTQPLTALSDTIWWVSKQWINQSITRDFPISRIEKDLWLTPTERMKVENTWITAWQFMLEKWLWWSPKEVQINKLQELADNSYNTITSQLKGINSKNTSTDAVKMLETMVDEMESSKILKREKSDYINKLKQLAEQKEYTPSELLAIRRDFDKIVWYQLFDSKWRVSWAEDSVIANWRSWLSDQIQKIWEDNWIDIKDMNTDLRNSIVIRDWLLRRLSQENKNNTFWLQDIWIWAILSAGEPITATAIIIGKKALENAIPWVSQKLYNLNKSKYEPTNMKRGVTINPRDKSNGFSIAPDTNDSVTNAWVKPKDIVDKLDQQIRDKKQWETPVKTVPKTTETKIEPKKATVDQELQKVAQKVKEKSIAKKENGSIMDSMKNYKTFDDYFNSLTDQQLIDLKGNPSKTILERTKIRKMWDEANPKAIVPKKEAPVKKVEVKKDPNVLDNLNPTWWLYVKYDPAKRASMKLADNIITLDKTMWVSPNKEITIYRGTIKSQNEIVPWDFVTTSKELAKSYAWDWKVIEMKVKASDVLDDINEPLGDEYIYRPKLSPKSDTPVIPKKK